MWFWSSRRFFKATVIFCLQLSMKRVRRRRLLNKIRIPLNLANQRGEWVPQDNLFDYLANHKSPGSARIDYNMYTQVQQTEWIFWNAQPVVWGGGLPVGGLFYLKRIYIDGSLNSRLFGRERRMILIKSPPTIAVAPNIYTHPFAMCWENIQWQHPQTTSNYKWIMGTLLRDFFLARLIQWKSLSANKLLQKSKWKLGKCDCRCLRSALVSFFWIYLRPHVSHPKEWFTGLVAGLAWIYFFVFLFRRNCLSSFAHPARDASLCVVD